MTILDQYRINWASFGVLRGRPTRTLKQRDDDTTIVFVVKKGNKPEIIGIVRMEICQVCKSTGNAELFVEILEGEIGRFSGIEYETKASGASPVSPTEVRYSNGTLGGYV